MIEVSWWTPLREASSGMRVRGEHCADPGRSCGAVGFASSNAYVAEYRPHHTVAPPAPTRPHRDGLSPAPGKQPPGDYIALDLVGALADFEDLGIGVET